MYGLTESKAVWTMLSHKKISVSANIRSYCTLKVTHYQLINKPQLSVPGSPTFALTTALHPFSHASHDFLDSRNGIAFHSWTRAFSSSFTLFNGWWFPRILLFRMSQTCLIGARSGERLGQGKVFTLFVCKKIDVSRTVCGLALPCWKTNPLCLVINHIQLLIALLENETVVSSHKSYPTANCPAGKRNRCV